MVIRNNPIIETYSRLAHEYENPLNSTSCWGQATERIFSQITLRKKHRVIADLGCGTGEHLRVLASRSNLSKKFYGIEPAPRMREFAIHNTREHNNVQVTDGSFESIPLACNSVDYLYSIFAFHWVSDADKSIEEIARILKDGGEMDIYFVGRLNGREFVKATTPIFLKRLGPIKLFQAVKLRLQLTREETEQKFLRYFDVKQLAVFETFVTFNDTLEGHMAWWVRFEGQLCGLNSDQMQACKREVKEALSGLSSKAKIPYTLHLLHVRIRA